MEMAAMEGGGEAAEQALKLHHTREAFHCALPGVYSIAHICTLTSSLFFH